MPTEEILGLVPYFASLRPDERLRVARRFGVTALETGATFPLKASLLIVVSGRLTLTAGTDTATLYTGDFMGAVGVLTSQSHPGVLTALERSIIATLDRAAFDAVLAEFPIVARPMVAELGRELAWRNEMMREICLAQSAGLPANTLAAMLARRRRRLRRLRHHPMGRIGASLVRVLFVEPARRPSFWMFAGVMSALIGSRAVVGMIVREGLQHRMFALIKTASGHPIHIHHFNYGLLLVALVGLLSFVPRVRGAMRVLCCLFGFGVGLVVDEFALLWNLNPDYYQPSSRLAAAAVLFVLAQLVYFPAFYVALVRRLFARVRP